MKFEKIVEVEPSYNKINTDPKKDYGIGSCRIRFVLKGEKGAVQFLIGTNWYVPSARQHLSKFPKSERDLQQKPDGWDIGYHSYVPMYDGQEPMQNACDILDGKPCYYDGSSLRADEMIEDFVAGGTDWLWKKLEEEYNSIFNPKQERG